MPIGPTLKEALHHREMKQLELALETNYSEKTVSAWVNETRRIPKEVRPKVCEVLDYPELFFETQMDATGGIGIPYLNGPYVEHHPASLIDRAYIEIEEAERKLKEVHTTKPVRMWDEQEIQTVQKANKELLDVAAVALTLVADNCTWLNLSFQKEIRDWQITLKARRMWE